MATTDETICSLPCNLLLGPLVSQIQHVSSISFHEDSDLWPFDCSSSRHVVVRPRGVDV